ncbi:hypothetical protein FPZ54_10565 [Sphingomonas suaedae]|uniref:Uncharacterized protein n=1 Tax=Sphingomonas suaedae TaxID=2599297 RepID=A0A518RG38_9SPHN|nr:hypothetical protein [Sphingomonas suaedae]QDX26422.1 hypothetical protein FPZ54_10565 [Sphingomonas suaedae]
MIRLAPLAAAAFCIATAATPALVQSAHYSATPADAPKKASFITQTTVWKCKDGTCVAPKSPMNDKVMCQRVVQRVGALTAFSAGDTAFDAEALAACNERAK